MRLIPMSDDNSFIPTIGRKEEMEATSADETE
jgi:hypothetical protein